MIDIRPPREQDLHAAADVLVAVHAADGYPVEGVADPVAWLLPAGLRRAWVAEHDGHIVGHIGLATAGPDHAAAEVWMKDHPEDTLGVLCRLFVSPAARGHALGERLLTVATDHASAEGLRTVGDVMATDAVAIHLYEKLGRQRIADVTHPDGHGNNIPAHCYVAPRQAGEPGSR